MQWLTGTRATHLSFFLLTANGKNGPQITSMFVLAPLRGDWWLIDHSLRARKKLSGHVLRFVKRSV